MAFRALFLVPVVLVTVPAGVVSWTSSWVSSEAAIWTPVSRAPATLGVKAIRAMDWNGDGRLSRREYTVMAKALKRAPFAETVSTELPSAKDFAEAMFDRLDYDADGYLSAREFERDPPDAERPVATATLR